MEQILSPWKTDLLQPDLTCYQVVAQFPVFWLFHNFLSCTTDRYASMPGALLVSDLIASLSNPNSVSMCVSFFYIQHSFFHVNLCCFDLYFVLAVPSTQLLYNTRVN